MKKLIHSLVASIAFTVIPAQAAETPPNIVLIFTDDQGYADLACYGNRKNRTPRLDKLAAQGTRFTSFYSQAVCGYCEPYANLNGVRRTYAGMLSAMDEAIGQVLAALDEKGIRDNTLIIFSSDNGGPEPGRVTSNGPLRAGKGTIYEGGVRVCACVNWPGHIPAGKTIDEPLHAVDWYPTLVNLTGATADQKLPLDGLDIWPVLTEGAESPHDALILCGTQRGQAAIRMGDWKLLVGAGNEDQLYNLAEDLGEKNNLAAVNPEKLKELRARYDAMMKSAVPSGAPADPGAKKKKKRK